MSLRLGSITDALGGLLHGDPETQILGLAPLETASAQTLSFLSNPKYRQQLAASQAGCVIVSPQMQAQAQARGACIVTEQPYLYFARVTQLWRQAMPPTTGPRIHPSAVIDESARIDPSASVGPLCVVEAGARIGAGTVLKSRVTVGYGCVIGERCIVHAVVTYLASPSRSRDVAIVTNRPLPPKC